MPAKNPRRREKARPVQQMQLFGLPKMVMPVTRVQPVKRLMRQLVSNRVIFKRASSGKVNVYANFAGHLKKFMMQPGTNAGKLVDYLIKQTKIGGFAGLIAQGVTDKILKESGAVKPVVRSREEQNALNEILWDMAYWISYTAAMMPIIRDIKRQAASSRPRGMSQWVKRKPQG